MQCELIQKDLVGFHFGTLGMEERKPLEDHLCDCADCLRAYLSLKSHFEMDLYEEAPKPSSDMKAKLLSEVTALFPPKMAKNTFSQRRRKGLRYLPYGSVFAATAAAVLFLVITNRHLTEEKEKITPALLPIASEVHGGVDSARQGVENVNFL